jgi:hypothetical protein
VRTPGGIAGTVDILLRKLLPRFGKRKRFLSSVHWPGKLADSKYLSF